MRVYNMNAWCLAFHAEDLRVYSGTALQLSTDSRATGACIHFNTADQQAAVVWSRFAGIIRRLGVFLGFFLCDNIGILELRAASLKEYFRKRKRGNHRCEKAGAFRDLHLVFFPLVCDQIFPWNAASTWQMCGSTTAAYRSVSPESIRACCAWKKNILYEPEDEMRYNRGSRDTVSFFAFTAPEQLSMWKMSEWDSVCKDGDSIWLFMHHHTHLMTITIILLLKQLTGSYTLFPPHYT